MVCRETISTRLGQPSSSCLFSPVRWDFRPWGRRKGDPPSKGVFARKQIVAQRAAKLLVPVVHTLRVPRQIRSPHKSSVAAVVRAGMGPRSVGVVRLLMRVVVPHAGETLSALFAVVGGFSRVREVPLPARPLWRRQRALRCCHGVMVLRRRRRVREVVVGSLPFYLLSVRSRLREGEPILIEVDLRHRV